MTKLLKLRAKDTEDLQVISAVLQDSIVPSCDMVFQSTNHSFVVVAQRLRRENGEEGANERICSALTINGVTSVQTQGVDLKQKDQMLDLLAIIQEQTQGKGGEYLSFVFAGNARVRLELKDWNAVVEDFGEVWPAQCHPCHDEAPT